MCRDDGPGNRWTGVYSLGYRPSAYHTALPTPQSSSISSTTPLTFHLYCFTPSCCVIKSSPPPRPPSHSLSPPLDLFLPRSFSSSVSPGRNRLSAKLRPNPLIFLHVVTARAAIPLFLRPFLLCWANGQLSDLRLAATCCKFTSSHVGAAH